jgi:N-formylmaleamate deformylase
MLVAAPAFAAPTSFTVAVQGKGPPVILIPGLACGGAVWDSTVARYRKNHELHVLTLAGFDGQKPIAPPLVATVRDELAEYIRAHKLQKPIVVGHSLGGFLAAWLAAAHPDAVGGIVIVDSLPFLPAAQMAGVTVAQVEPRAAMMRDAIAKSPPDAFEKQNRAALAQMVTDPKNVEPIAAMGKRSDPASVANAMYELMTTDLRPLLPKVKAPAVVLAADEDGTALHIYEEQWKPLAGVKIVPVKSRHFIFVDAPAAFFAQLDAVLGAPR